MGLSVASIISIGLAFVVLLLFKVSPGMLKPWVVRTAIVLGFMGGAALAVSQAGEWLADRFLTVVDAIGGTGSAWVVIGTLAVFVWAAREFYKKPKPTLVYVAIFIPVLLGLFSSGCLADLDSKTSVPAREKANDLSDEIGQLRGGR